MMTLEVQYILLLQRWVHCNIYLKYMSMFSHEYSLECNYYLCGVAAKALEPILCSFID